MGKAYANRRKEKDRPKGDLYHSPKSIGWKLLDNIEFKGLTWEPASGDNALIDSFEDRGLPIFGSDLDQGWDFLNPPEGPLPFFNNIVTNPPFSLFDEFVMQAKHYAPSRIALLGRTNYLGTYSRDCYPWQRDKNLRKKYGLDPRIWDGLSQVLVFNRMIDYQTERRSDGLFHVGNMVTCWFIWDKGYIGDPVLKILDVQDYAKLGCYQPEKPKEDLSVKPPLLYDL